MDPLPSLPRLATVDGEPVEAIPAEHMTRTGHGLAGGLIKAWADVATDADMAEACAAFIARVGADAARNPADFYTELQTRIRRQIRHL